MMNLLSTQTCVAYTMSYYYALAPGYDFVILLITLEVDGESLASKSPRPCPRGRPWVVSRQVLINSV